jgi:parvulin-like peptidyl-prolyl isomerase
MQLPRDRWETVASTAGWHVVRVEAIAPSRLATLDEARAAAEADWRAAQTRKAVEAGLQRLRARYRVREQETMP